ncbi:MAG: hypothetical protein KDA25_04145 [Phycisphaerales bacterium]|nr:hypothetical protein [Phycisphaerales bacterium]
MVWPDFPMVAWCCITLFVGWAVLASLKTIANRVDHDISLHDLRVEAFRLRRAHLRYLAEANGYDEPGEVDIVEVGVEVDEPDRARAA